jgi:prepilin-type N-terminal cleavage/methylation domain-containing protein
MIIEPFPLTARRSLPDRIVGRGRSVPAGSGPAAPRQRGVTLLELVIALAVLALLLSMAGPPYAGMVARHRLIAAAEHLAADLAEARQESARRGVAVYAVFQPGQAWCYAIALNPDTPCASSGGTGALKLVSSADHPGIALLEAANLSFDARDGSSLQAAVGHARFASARGDQVQVQVSRLGRAGVCAPADTSSPRADLPRC